MTENEAITYLGYFKNWNNDDRWLSDETMEEFVKCCVEALKEIQQYREIGTVEEIKTAKKYIDLKKKCGTPTNTIDVCAEYVAIGTVEECREAMEKQKAKKPKEILRHRGGFELRHCPNCNTDYEVDGRYTITDGYCPKCGKLLDSAFRHYCGNCGQAIDENLEGMEDE